MTETSQHTSNRRKPIGAPLPSNPQRFAHLTDNLDPVHPEGLKGYLANNPDWGKNDGHYHPPLIFSTNPADALPASHQRHHTQQDDVDVCEDDN